MACRHIVFQYIGKLFLNGAERFVFGTCAATVVPYHDIRFSFTIDMFAQSDIEPFDADSIGKLAQLGECLWVLKPQDLFMQLRKTVGIR